ncbi:MAG TPA: Spy/CpxP family protein refolding chaperone, partial [Stellaceae bacterium]|nr:Spy/CpxP family protein refolding chaperone [Stellaceae bacterium]
MGPDMMGDGGMGPGMMGYGGMGPGMMGYGGMGPGMMGPGMMGPGMMSPGMSGPAMCSAMAGHIDGRLAYIKAELKINDAQEPLWKTYAAVERDNANAMLGHCTAMMNRPGAASSLPDRIDQHEQMMAAHLEQLRSLSKALKPLYAAFDDGQKQTADQLLWGHMGMM